MKVGDILKEQLNLDAVNAAMANIDSQVRTIKRQVGMLQKDAEQKEQDAQEKERENQGLKQQVQQLTKGKSTQPTQRNQPAIIDKTGVGTTATIPEKQ